MRRFFIKKGLVFTEGDIRWTVLNALPDGRVQFESQTGELLRLEDGEIWECHESGVWKIDRDSIAETGAEPIEIRRRDVSTFKEKDVCDGRMRLVYLQAVQEAKCRGLRRTDAILARVAESVGCGPPSYRSFCRWSGLYSIGNDLIDVIPRHERKGRTSILTGPLLDLVEDVVETRYLNGQRPTVSSLYNHVLEEIKKKNRSMDMPLPLLSRATLYRFVQTLDRYAVTASREGRDAAKRKYRSVNGTLKTTRINERWEIDHTPVDLLAVCPIRRIAIVRPVLTIVIDAHSRMIVGFHIGARVPSQEEIAVALRMSMFGKNALLKRLKLDNVKWNARGIPVQIVTDNGSEFHGSGMRLGCGDLGIILTYCPRRSPWHKGRVERFMGTISDQLFHRIPGTTWSDIEERGDYDSLNLACVTIDDLTRLVVRWIVECYQHTPHRGLKKKTPFQVWEESSRTQLLQMPEDPVSVELAFAGVDERLITRQGITYEHLSYNSQALQQLGFRLPEGESVRIRYYSHQIDRIHVLDPLNKEYIEVPCSDPVYTAGLTSDMHRMLIDQLNKEKAPVDAESLRRARIGIDKTIDDLYRSHRLRDRKKAAQAEGQSSRTTFDASHPASGGDEVPAKQMATDVDIPVFNISKRT